MGLLVCSTTTASSKGNQMFLLVLTQSRQPYRPHQPRETPTTIRFAHQGLFPDITTEIQPEGQPGPAIQGRRRLERGSGLGEADARAAGGAARRGDASRPMTALCWRGG